MPRKQYVEAVAISIASKYGCFERVSNEEEIVEERAFLFD